MRSRVLMLLIAIILGVLAAYFAFRYLDSAQEDLAAEQEPVEVLVAQQDLDPGANADELLEQDYISPAEVPQQYVAEGAVSSEAAIAGKVLASPVSKGEQITAARFKLPVEAGLAYAVPEDFVAVSIPNNAVTGVSGLIRPGDHVAVLGTFEDDGGLEGAVTRIILPKARVVAVGAEVTLTETDEETEAEDDGGLAGSAARATTTVEAPGTVTLAISAPDAEKLVFAEEEGSVWLALLSSQTAEVPTTSGMTFPAVIQ